ncbi:MAG: hypothetical protein ACPGYV_01010 [Phycisphaeraceae bacterium]
MFQFLQPAGTVFIGLAMFIYGSVQALLHQPSASSFQVAAQAMPDAIAVIVFAFGIAAVVVGIVLLISGVKGVRRRAREINRAYGHRPHHRPSRDEYEDAWENEMHPAYR